MSLSLIHSPHLCLFPSFSVSLFCGVPPAAAKKEKNIVRLHSSSPLLNSVVVTLDDKGVKRKRPSHYILFLFCFVFLFTVVYLGIWLFFSLLPLTHHPAPCIFFISMSVFGFPIWCWGGRLVEGSDVVSVRTSGGRSQRRERGYKEEVYVEPRLMQLLRIRK